MERGATANYCCSTAVILRRNERETVASVECKKEVVDPSRKHIRGDEPHPISPKFVNDTSTDRCYLDYIALSGVRCVSIDSHTFAFCHEGDSDVGGQGAASEAPLYAYFTELSAATISRIAVPRLPADLVFPAQQKVTRYYSVDMRRNGGSEVLLLVEFPSSLLIACFIAPSSLVFSFLALALNSQRDASQGPGGEAGDRIARMSTTSPARHHTNITARSQGEDEEMAAQKPDTSSRQRPLSAPPKAYPFSRDLEHSRDHDSPGKAGYRAATALRVAKGDINHPQPREVGRLRGGGESRERPVGGHGGQAAADSVESKAAEQRLSLSSIFGAASERRASEGKRSDARNSRLLHGNDRSTNNNGAAQPGFQENGEKGSPGKVAFTVARLSPKDFGLHQWKEYAVLR